jgi:hypothetical protein
MIITHKLSKGAHLIQWLCGLEDVSLMGMTKLVECPVVDSVPRRAVVRYTGQL